MKYLILKFDREIALKDPSDIALVMAYWPDGKALAINTNDDQPAAHVVGWYPVRSGGSTEEAIDANLTPWEARQTTLPDPPDATQEAT